MTDPITHLALEFRTDDQPEFVVLNFNPESRMFQPIALFWVEADAHVGNVGLQRNERPQRQRASAGVTETA